MVCLQCSSCQPYSSYTQFGKQLVSCQKMVYSSCCHSLFLFYSYFSGPKRYDLKNGSWIYTHDGACLHNLLSSEISLALGHEVDFTLLPHGGADKNG